MITTFLLILAALALLGLVWFYWWLMEGAQAMTYIEPEERHDWTKDV